MMMEREKTLVVPIRLEALAVNQYFKQKPVRRWIMDYARLKDKNDPEPPAFDEAIDQHYFDHPDHWGVYLHWMVPAALRKGGQTEDNQTDFPPLPNRWLVARQHGDAFRYWLIKSDEMAADNDGGSAFGYLDIDGRVHTTRIGKSYDLASYDADIWAIEKATFQKIQDTSRTGQGPVSPCALNAIGLGNVNFLAYQPFVNDVFSFHDDLKEIRPRDDSPVTGPLHYFVAGWYSDPVEDVLHQGASKEVNNFIDALNWRVNGGEADQLKAFQRTLYYGRQYHVDWQKATHVADTIDKEGLQVVLGNNSQDAVMALLEKTDFAKDAGGGMLRFLKSFMYGLLPLAKEPGGQARFNREVYKTWFKAKSGGCSWALASSNAGDEPKPDVHDDIKELLTSLNERQEEIEALQVELEGLQKLFYDLWWQDQTGNGENGEEAGDKTEGFKQSDLARVIQDKIKILVQTKDDLDSLFRQLHTRLSGRREAPCPPPNDISAVISHLQKDHGLIQRAKPPFWKPHDPTLLIAGLGSKFETGSDEALVCLPAAQLLPSKQAPAAKLAGNSIICGLHEDFVSRRDQDEYQWEQPWNPYFLEWEVEWFPHAFESGPAESKTDPDGQIIKGRTFLTSQNNPLLRFQLEELKATVAEKEDKSADGALKSLQALVDDIVRQRPLSQNLAEFNNQLQVRATQLSIIPPDEELRALIGEQYQSHPMKRSSGSSHYQSIRQGHFKIKRLEVYDGFGQCLVLVGPQGLNEYRTFAPIMDNDLSPGGRTINSDHRIALKTRILEYSRLRFDYVDIEDDGRIMGIHQDVNPIAGWVLYNHLDRSLVLFNAQGEDLGELRIIRGKVTEIDLDRNIGKAFKAYISQIPTNAQLFNLFLNIIDETLWTIEPDAGMQEKHLAVWVGRPLAIVRTRLRFEVGGAGNIPLDLIGRPADDGPVALFKQAQQQLRDFQFNIRLGSRGIRQDGLIGYFLDGVFYTVHDLKAIPSDYAGPIRPIRQGLVVSGPDHWTQYLTLLVDPGAAVYAQTDFLPYTSLRLPERMVSQALEKVQVNFRYHCMLTHLNKTALPGERDRMTMPLPALRKGTWEWVENKDQRYDLECDVSAGQTLVEPPSLRDGRLFLRDPFRKA